MYGQVAVQGIRDVPNYESVQPIFGGSFTIAGARLSVSVLWALLVITLATYILLRTRAGNWIFAVGGAQISARQTGVPVLRTKVGLFMGTAGAGWLVGMISLFQSSTVRAHGDRTRSQRMGRLHGRGRRRSGRRGPDDRPPPIGADS